MKNLSFLSLLLFVLITLNSCKEDTPQPFSQVYFSCKIDGVPFNPEYKTDFGYRSIDANKSGNSLLISADGIESGIGIGISNDRIEKNIPYKLHINSSLNSAIFKKNRFSTESYITDSINIGYIIFTELDTINNIIVGTFYFDAYDSTKNDTVHITDGKFRAYLR